MAASFIATDQDLVILKAGWIYRQKPLTKRWKKTWMVLCLGGSLKCYKNRRSSSTQKQFDIKKECMAIKAGRQCKDMLPPKDIDVECMIQLFLTGGRNVKLCAHDQDSANLWMQAFLKAHAEKQLPQRKHSRKNRTKKEALEEESKVENQLQKRWYSFLCCGTRQNKVKVLKTPRNKQIWT